MAVEELVVESASQERAEIAFLAASIFRNLEKVSGDKYNKSPLSEVEQLLVRQVQCSLPSVKPDEVQVRGRQRIMHLHNDPPPFFKSHQMQEGKLVHFS